MSTVNWQDLLPGMNVRVLFSNLEIPELRDDIDDAVAALRLPSGVILDITWKHSEHKYVLSVHTLSLRSPCVAQSSHAAVSSLVDAVTAWARKCQTGIVNVSNAAPCSTDFVVYNNDLRAVFGAAA
jgi:hypothetical protein